MSIASIAQSLLPTVLPTLVLLYTLSAGSITQKAFQVIKKASTFVDGLSPLTKQVAVGLISLGFVKLGQFLSVQIDPTTTLDNVSVTTVGTLITALVAYVKHNAEKLAAK